MKTTMQLLETYQPSEAPQINKMTIKYLLKNMQNKVFKPNCRANTSLIIVNSSIKNYLNL